MENERYKIQSIEAIERIKDILKYGNTETLTETEKNIRKDIKLKMIKEIIEELEHDSDQTS